jgi:hypothetical protein
MHLIFCRRWLFIITTLFCFTASYSQALKRVEYFYDTDPGFGNGKQVTLSGVTVDSTFTFDVSSLSNGLHLLYVRAQDVNEKWSLYYTKSFIKTSGNNSALGIKRVEYFYDTDPGFGNGKQVTLSGVTVDSTFTFDISLLNNGLHLLYVRAQDITEKWSLYYTKSFIKTSGNDSALVINKVEYFYDTDPGFGNGINVPIQSAGIINDTFNFQLPDNGAASRRLYIRAQDSRGQWSLLYDKEINLCDIYKAQPNFSYIRFADLYSFIDSSKNNPSHKLLWNFDNLGIDSVSNPQFIFPQGKHSVQLIAGTGCRKDTIVIPLFVGLESHYPDTAFAGGNLIMNFYGGGLDTAVAVSFVNASGTINPFAKRAFGLRELNAVFDLHTVAAGIYNVKLHFSNGYDTTIVNGLNILQPNDGIAYEPDLSVTIVGPTIARVGSQVKLELVITNNGGMVAESVPLWMTLGVNGTGISNGYNLNQHFIPPLNSPNINYQDSVPTSQSLDSLMGKPWHGRLENEVISYINAGESYRQTFTITAPPHEGDYIDIYAYTGKRMNGSFLRGRWNDCLESAFDFVAGFVPGFGCINSLWNYAAYDIPGFYHGTNTTGNFLWSTAGAFVSCFPGGTLVKKLGQAEEVVKAVEHTFKAYDVAHNTASGVYAYSTSLYCDDPNDPKNQTKKETTHRVSVDPNEIDGPNGYANGNYINGRGKLGYRIAFENTPAATANAQRVYIADTLDKTKYDLRTFELSGFTFGDSTFILPPQRKEYTTTIDLRPNTNLLLRFNAKLDTSTGILRYTYLSIDPATRDTLPLSDLRGFLPPNINGTSGTGSVSYLVTLIKALQTNTVITNTASIVFDNNAPIITNTWLNTIDKTPPIEKVSGGIKLNDTTLRINLGGSDIGSGIQRSKLYVAENAKPYVFLGMIYGDTLRFTGSLDSTYRFYAIPYDSVNNFSPKPPTAEYTVTLRRSAYVSSPTDYFRSVNSGVWNNAATWESSSDNITYYPATLTPDVNANTITIRNGHTVNVIANVTTDQTIVNPLAALVVTGSILSVTNNGLTLKSDATGTARIGNSTGTISGNVIAERFIPANGKRAWRLLSVPTATSQSINAAWQNSQPKGIIGISGIGTMITSNNGNASFDFQTPGNSMLAYNSTADAFTGVSNTTSSIATDNGYFLFIRGDRTATPLNNIISSATLSTIGTLKQGNYPASPIAVSANKFGVIGNPYASQIDFRNIIKGSGIDNTFYVWDPRLTGLFGVGAYQTLTLNNGNYIITPGGGSYGSAGSVMNTIESGQAFFVHSTSTDNISFTENAKSSGSNMVFRTVNDVPKSFISNLYSVDAAGDNLTDGNMILLNDNYSNNVDGSDALKLENFGVNLGMIRNNKTLSVEKRMSFSANDTIFFNLNNTKQQQYRFEFITNGIQQSGLSGWLVDKYLNTTTPIDLNGNTSILFSVNVDSSSAAANRFSIVFIKPLAVPVNNKSSIVIYPNPVINGVVKVQLNNQPKGHYLVRLLNSLGQVILTKQINHAEGTSTESVGLNGIKGIYMLELMKPDNNKVISKMIIN